MRNSRFGFGSLDGFFLFGIISWLHDKISVGFFFLHLAFHFILLVLVEHEDGLGFDNLAFLNLFLFIWLILYLFRIIQRYNNKILVPVVLNFLIFIELGGMLILEFLVIFIFWIEWWLLKV